MIIWKSYIWTGEGIPENEAIFEFDQDGKCFFLEGMDLRTGNFRDELLNF